MARTRPIVALLITFIVSACADRAPLSPTSALTFDGVWTGELRLTTCSGQRHCGLFIGDDYPFTLRIRQTGRSARGTFESSGNLLSTFIDLEGQIDASDGMRLTAVRSASRPSEAGAAEADFSLTRQRHGLAGRVHYEIRGLPFGSDIVGPVLHDAEIVSASRSPLPTDVGVFAGVWKGRYVVGSCSSVGWLGCNPRVGQISMMQLRLDQADARVSGELSGLWSGPMPVTGQVSSGQLLLQGEVTLPTSGGREIVRVTAWTSAHDGLGQMTGRFSYVVETHFNTGAVFSYTFDSELWGMTLVP